MILVAAVVIGVLFLAHTAPFPFLIEVFAGDRTMWRVPPDGGKPTVYLTFDDGPNPDATPELLDVLARERVRATFFLIDRWVGPETAPIVTRMFEEGHGVALHSDDRWLMLQGPTELARTLREAADRVERLTGHRPCKAFRPHAGWRSGLMVAGLRRIDHRLVGWGWFAWDWNWFSRRTADSIVERIVRRAGDGVIVVIHDGHHAKPRADRRYAAEATARLVPALRTRGFDFGTVCEALEGERESPAPIPPGAETGTP